MVYLQPNKHHIAAALQELGLEKSDLREIPPSEAKRLLKGIKDHFCTTQKTIWLWECFRKNLPYYSKFPGSYKVISEIVPDKDEKVWFVVEENGIIFRLYIGTVATIQKVLGECPFFEYYLVACDYSWLICETHHAALIALGDKIVTKFRELDSLNPDSAH